MESFTTRASAQPLKNPEELIEFVETFIFDCDGEGSYCFSFLNKYCYIDKKKKGKNLFNAVELDLFVYQSITMCVWDVRTVVLCALTRANLCLFVCLG